MQVKTLEDAEEIAAGEREKSFAKEPAKPRLTFLMDIVRRLWPEYRDFTELQFFENAVGDRQQAEQDYKEAIGSGGECLIMRGFLEEKISRYNREAITNPDISPDILGKMRSFADVGYLIQLAQRLQSTSH
jgi:hypothetical protein